LQSNIYGLIFVEILPNFRLSGRCWWWYKSSRYNAVWMGKQLSKFHRRFRLPSSGHTQSKKSIRTDR